MRTTQTADTRDQRRKLLKGALGASTVVTLGYSSTTAAASITCIAKTTASPNVQFYSGTVPPTDSKLEWKSVLIYEFSTRKDLNEPFNYFCLIEFTGYAKYHEVVAGDLIPDPRDETKDWYPTNAAPTQAWVLRYFDPQTGEEVGTYPVFTSPLVNGAAPASVDCLNSVDAANARTSGFSG